jgi:hypothetical protein
LHQLARRAQDPSIESRTVQLLVVASLLVLRIMSGIMFSAAAGLLVATAVLSLGGSERPEWLQSISTTALALAAALGGGAVGLFLLMPARAALIRRVPAEQDQKLAPIIVIVILGLLGLTVLLVPTVLAWGARSLALLHDLTGHRSDSLGLAFIPAAVLFAAPLMALMALAASAVAAVLSLSAPASHVPRVLAGCACVQAGLVAGVYLMERGIRVAGAAVRQFVDGASDPAASAQVAGWLARHDVAAGASGTRLTWLLGGFLVALALTWVVAARRPTPTRGAAAVVDPPSFATASPVAVPPIQPSASSDFEGSAYSVRPRKTWLGPFDWSPTTYDIASIPPMSRLRFSFSWTTGMIRREPQGPDLFTVTASKGRAVLGQQRYVVADLRTGSEVGTLLPSGADWELRGASGESLAEVLQIEQKAGRARYLAKSGDEEICRFVWGFTGMTAGSAELQLDFLPGSDRRVPKVLAIALGPVLEHRARRASHRYS